MASIIMGRGRETSPLGLHRRAVGRLAKLSAAPGQQRLDDDQIWREHWHVIRSRLERVHDKLDEAEGLGPAAVRTMLAEEKDRAILSQGRGFTARAVVDLLGADIAGSPETVRRVRRKHGYRSGDGEPLPGASSS